MSLISVLLCNVPEGWWWWRLVDRWTSSHARLSHCTHASADTLYMLYSSPMEDTAVLYTDFVEYSTFCSSCYLTHLSQYTPKSGVLAQSCHGMQVWAFRGSLAEVWLCWQRWVVLCVITEGALQLFGALLACLCCWASAGYRPGFSPARHEMAALWQAEAQSARCLPLPVETRSRSAVG